MSEQLIEQIYKALRLVPEFDGNSNVLTRFINLCEQLVSSFVRVEPGYELSNLALLNGILNKITGPAARTLSSNGITENWLGIKNSLINNFADHRDETSLYNDLSLISQGSSTPQEFYEQCQNLYSVIMTYVALHESVNSTIEAKRALYKKLTLQAFLRGLRDPLGSRIRCMRPESIEKALEFVHEEQNTLYIQQRNQALPDRKPQFAAPSFNFNSQPALPTRGFNFAPAYNMPGPSHQVMYHPSPKPMPNWRPQIPQIRGPTRTQQIFSAPPPNYRPQSNAFRMPHPKPNNGPQPMSGVSHYVTKSTPPRPAFTGHDWMRHGNPPPSNYFKTRELNFNEGYDNYDYYFDNYNDNYNDYYNDFDYYGPSYFEPVYNVTSEQFLQDAGNPLTIVEEPQCDSNPENFQKTTEPEKPR